MFRHTDTQQGNLHFPLRRGDIVVYLCILLLCFLFAAIMYVPHSTRFDKAEMADTVKIHCADTEYVYALSENRMAQVKSAGYTLSIFIQDGAVWVDDADCPDHICIASGKISRIGSVIVCLPAGVIITIEGKEAEVDAILG